MGWLSKFRNECLQVPGQHILATGTTGTGKTQALYWVVEGLTVEAPKETIVYFDSGKSSEIAVLSQFKPLNIIIPESMDVEIEGENIDYRITEISEPADAWTHLYRNRINVVCVEPYIRDPEKFTPVVSQMFTELINLAHEYRIKTPMTVAYDEMNIIAPGKGYAFSPEHAKFGATIQWNIERLRSLGIRFLGSSQGFTQLRLGVRKHFHWHIAKNGTIFKEGRLMRYNQLFEGLRRDQAILIYPENYFSDVLTMPYYGEGEALGRVRYVGSLTEPNDKRYDPDRITLHKFLGKPDPEEAAETPAPDLSEVLNLLDDDTKQAILSALDKGSEHHAMS